MVTLIYLPSIWVWLLRCCGKSLDLCKRQLDHCLHDKQERTEF